MPASTSSLNGPESLSKYLVICFSASADFSMTTDLSFGIEAFGVKLAKWETSFTYLGPYNIWKYPE